ncbi:MAG: hypothetical protein QHD01_02920 [Bradyrhizobium sp.]|uniref:hypothetical protein n=1 Tax=Bradyrhizobium sp. TaxID=376 RepID=UPI0029A3A90E|nr:hypothetical protein [Bradyrhizobium sp.]MDX3965537.1 hypothetical protein [Bradyrhizobium sp.]
MNALTYTMSVEDEAGTEEIVARGVSLERALCIAIEHDGTGRATVTRREVGTGHVFSVGRRLFEDGAFECLAFAFMPRARFPELDRDCAVRTFERTLLENSGEFWRGRVETDGDHARRRRNAVKALS